MVTWNAAANAQMAEISQGLTDQKNRDVRAAIVRWAEQNHYGITSSR